MRYHARNAAKDTNEAVKHMQPARLHKKTMKMQRRIQKRVLFERPLMHFYALLLVSDFWSTPRILAASFLVTAVNNCRYSLWCSSGWHNHNAIQIQGRGEI